MRLCSAIFLSLVLSCQAMPFLALAKTKKNKEPLAVSSEWEQLPKGALQIALEGYQVLLDKAVIKPGALLTLIDLSKVSSEQRLYVLDPAHKKILLRTLVAHGCHSGYTYAKEVSNQPSSYKSCAGFFLTKETYIGKNGYSLRLVGLQNGLNDNALARGIVIHGAPYVDLKVSKKTGWVGRSQGCPAVPIAVHRQLIDLIKENNCLFIYHPSYSAGTPLRPSSP